MKKQGLSALLFLGFLFSFSNLAAQYKSGFTESKSKMLSLLNSNKGSGLFALFRFGDRYWISFQLGMVFSWSMDGDTLQIGYNEILVTPEKNGTNRRVNRKIAFTDLVKFSYKDVSTFNASGDESIDGPKLEITSKQGTTTVGFYTRDDNTVITKLNQLLASGAIGFQFARSSHFI